MRYVIILLLFVPFLSGCGTFFARTGWRAESPFMTKLYPATSWDYHFAVRLGVTDYHRTGRSINERIGNVCMGVLDAPISIITDTVWLPFDFILYFLKDDE